MQSRAFETVITEIKQSGNYFYKAKDYVHADRKYKKALRYIEWWAIYISYILFQHEAFNFYCHNLSGKLRKKHHRDCVISITLKSSGNTATLYWDTELGSITIRTKHCYCLEELCSAKMDSVISTRVCSPHMPVTFCSFFFFLPLTGLSGTYITTEWPVLSSCIWRCFICSPVSPSQWTVGQVVCILSKWINQCYSSMSYQNL